MADELWNLGKTPISEAAPAGQDVQSCPEWDALNGEIDKLSSLTGSKVDWVLVGRLAADILRLRSKDLRVATYLNVALAKTSGVEGLATGVHILRDLLEVYWESMTPPLKRMRGRKNAVDWWSEKLEATAHELQPQTWPQNRRDLFVTDLEDLDTFLAVKMDDPPMLQPIIRQLADLVVVPEIKPLPVQEPPTPTSAPAPVPERAPLVQLPQETNDPQDPDRLVRQAMDLLRQGAALLQERNRLDPQAYLLNRAAAWLMVQELPPAQQGLTRLPPPSEQILNSLWLPYRAGNWAAVLDVAEGLTGQYLFWLDPSRCATEALEQLGQVALAQRIGRELLAYLQRLPGLEHLAFNDGSPFADADTKQWIKDLEKKFSPAAVPAGALEAHIQEIINELQNHELGEALKQLSQRAQCSSSRRETLLWKLQILRLLMRGKKEKAALACAREVLQMVDQHALEAWDPDLAVEALEDCFAAVPKDELLSQNLLERLTRLDPARAILLA